MIKSIFMGIFCVSMLPAAENPITIELPASLIQTSFAQPDSGSSKSYYLPESGIVYAANLFLRTADIDDVGKSTHLESMHTKLFNQMPFAELKTTPGDRLFATIARVCRQVNANVQGHNLTSYNTDGHVWIISSSSACMILLKADGSESIGISELRFIDPNKKMVLALNIKNLKPNLKLLCEDTLRLASKNPNSFTTSSHTILEHIAQNRLQSHHTQSIVTLVQIRKLLDYIKKQEKSMQIQTFTSPKNDRSCCLWPFSLTDNEDYQELARKK